MGTFVKLPHDPSAHTQQRAEHIGSPETYFCMKNGHIITSLQLYIGGLELANHHRRGKLFSPGVMG